MDTGRHTIPRGTVRYRLTQRHCVLGAIGIHQRAGISFWDSMIVRSAAEMGCNVRYSEDLNTGQDYSGVRVENPFQPPKADPE